jgi:regulator of sirC expression with transglutaminase-like and TPR domain
VLFDPFHGGRVLRPQECEALVERVTGESIRVTAELLQATPAGLVVQRMLSNLKGVYLRDGDFARAARVMGRLRQLAPDDAQQWRDLGAALLQAGHPGRAIDHLRAYLAAAPEAADAGLVRQVLDKARAAVAKWN